MFSKNIIDSQEKSKENVSALFLNNKKIQNAKSNPTTMKCLELFGDFLETYKLTNTSEVFSSEADYKKSTDIRKQLSENLAGKPSTALIQSLIEKTKGLKIPQPKEELVTFKAQMNDLQAKSAKLDQMLERRKQSEEKKPTQDDKIQLISQKQPEIAKFTNILEDNQKIEVNKLNIEDSPYGKNSKMMQKLAPQKNTKEDSISDFSSSNLKKEVAQPKMTMNFINPTQKIEKNQQQKITNESSQKGIMNTNQNSVSNDFILNEEKGSSAKKNVNLKESSYIQTENDELVTASHGVDNTVDSDILEDYDYAESIEKM